MMETAVKTLDIMSENVARKSLFSYLDKGIDDLEAGRMHGADEAFQIIKSRLADEV